MQIFYPHIGASNDNALLVLKHEHLLRCWTRYCYCIDATVIELSAEGEQGRSQVFIGGGGARWGNVKFIHKTLLQNINPKKFLL